MAKQLVRAADQFIVLPGSRMDESATAQAHGSELRSIYAGYHWFGDWGRDTMISLEGLTLCTRRYREAAAILRTFASYVRDGLLPNLFPEGERQALYHTVDATLWFFHSIARYVETTSDRSVLEDLFPTLQSIVRHHNDGTRYGINITYNLSWLRQEENQYLSVPFEVARTLPVDLLRLIGYARGAYALGYVDDLRDPIEVLRPDLAHDGLGDLGPALERARQQLAGQRS